MPPVNNPYRDEVVLLHAPADRTYCNYLKRHLQFAQVEQPIGRFQFLCLENTAKFRTALMKRAEQIAAFIFLVSHYLVTSEFGGSADINRLLRAHRHRRLRLIPVFLDNCSLRLSPLAKLERLPSNGRAVNEMVLDPYRNEALAALTDDIFHEIAAIRSFHDSVWAAWQAPAYNCTASASKRERTTSK